ncbi:MAG: RNA ligase family protein [Gemmatimonadaceae bacterium]
MTEHIASYPSIYNIGHKAAADLFDGPVVVEEKIDGSQFSFGVTTAGDLRARSKGKDLVPDAPEQMFARAIETVRELAPVLTPGWIYRGEYLQKPKHNTLAYSRVPTRHIILFDVTTGVESWLSPDDKRAEAARVGLECVPLVHVGTIESPAALTALMREESILGGTTPEGLVVKNYARFGADKKTLMGKYVTEAFKEVHGREWKASNPSRGDVIQDLIARYKTTARWQKAVQHLREAGALEGSPKDIGALIREVPADIRKECEEEIKAALFAYAWPQIQRAVVGGLPQWYQDELLASAFAQRFDDDAREGV